MAKRRLINTKFWSDGFIVELEPLARYLFLYLLTNEHTEICGVYELPIAVLERETSLNRKTILNLLEPLQKRINYFEGWVYIKNFTKNQSSNENMEKGAKRSFEELPDKIKAKIKEIDERFETLQNASEPSGKPKLKLKLKLKPNGVLQSNDCEIPNLLKDKQKHIQIIGLYAKAKKIIFNNKDKQQSFITRNLRPAKNLKGYEIYKIIQTLKWLIDNADFKWTLETVGKFIDEDLSKLSTGMKLKTEDDIIKELINKK